MKSDSQRAIVLKFFKDNPGRLCTPFEVQKAVLPLAPITSVRRSMSRLTKGEKLEKTETRGMGKYGAVNRKWKLAEGVTSNSVTKSMF